MAKEIPSNADIELFGVSRNTKFSTKHGGQRPGDDFPEEAASLTVEELGVPKVGASTVTKADK